MPERFKVVCTMQGAIQVLCFFTFINMTSARLFIESENLAQAVEFANQLKVCAKAWEDTANIPLNAESDALVISFQTLVISSNCRFSVQTFLNP